MAATEFVPNQAKTEGITAHVIWLTTGLSCEGDSVAMTGATFQKFTYGPVFRYMRKRNLEKTFDKEPEWRHNRAELTSGYAKRW